MKKLKFLFLLLFVINKLFAQPGALDNSFDNDGKVGTDVSGSDYGYSVTIQPDGKIVMAGSGQYNLFIIARYNTDGTLDNTFGYGGTLHTIVGDYYSGAYSVAIQQDGKIVLAGYVENGSNDEFALVRYNSNGTLDSTFNSTGIVSTNFSSNDDIARAVSIQQDGKIVAAGYTKNGV